MSDIHFSGVDVYPHVTGDNAMRGPSVDVTALAQQIAALPVQTLVELASSIVAVDAVTADRLVEMLIDATYDARQAEIVTPVAKSPAVRGRITQAIIRPDFFIDPSEYDYQLAMMQ